jgi:capsular exopolysaccharide synthesis family protein
LPDEGKTFCAINYAIACAQDGLRTLLIDCDLRLRSLTKIFFSEGNLRGLSNLIAGESILDICVQRTSTDNLFILTAGARVPNPLELLSSAGLAEILEEAKISFDRIVIDTAPVTPVSDALLLMRSVDYVCAVIAAGRTSRDVVSRSMQKITEGGGKPVGFILNRVPAIPALAGYYGYTTHGYGDGVYESKEIEVKPSVVGRKDLVAQVLSQLNVARLFRRF